MKSIIGIVCIALFTPLHIYSLTRADTLLANSLKKKIEGLVRTKSAGWRSKADQLVNELETSFVPKGYDVKVVEALKKEINPVVVPPQEVVKSGTKLDKEAITKQLDRQLTLVVDAQWNNVVDDLLFDLSMVDRSLASSYSQKVREKIAGTSSTSTTSTVKDAQQESQPVNSAMQGIIALQEFRKLTPGVFGNSLYVNGVLDKKWLTQALKLLLNGASLTLNNRMDIQGELSGNATELIRELLQKDKNIKSDQWEKKLADVHNQVVSFIDSQLLPVQEKQPEIITVMPSWISSKNNTFLVKEFEIDMLNYIFKNSNAKKKEIVEYFVVQIPANLPTKDAIIQGIKDSVENTFKKSEQEVQDKSNGKVPTWIIQKDKKHYTLDPKQFSDALYNAMADDKNVLHAAMAKEGADVDKVIREYFVSQVPDTIPNKAAIIEQIQFELELYWLKAGK